MPNVHLSKNTVVINPNSWKLFERKNYPSCWDYCTEPLERIDRKDMHFVKAYIGSIEKRQCYLLSEEFEWLQLASHGYNGFDNKNIYKSDKVKITNLVNVYSDPISQYVITMYFLFNTLSIRCIIGGGNNRNKIKTTRIKDSPIVFIYGLGHIGDVLAQKCKKLGWTVYGIKRNCSHNISYVDSILTFQQSIDKLQIADYVVNLLPESRETEGVFDKSFFEKMQNTALFCNVGRCSAINDLDLKDAVENNVILGAILDVHSDFNYESTNILLTNHTSYLSCDNDELINTFFSSQLNSFIKAHKI